MSDKVCFYLKQGNRFRRLLSKLDYSEGGKSVRYKCMIRFFDKLALRNGEL